MTGNFNVLYVEDSSSDAILLNYHMARLVTDRALVIDVAKSIEKSVEMFDFCKYEAVLIDWNLPTGSGLEVAQEIRRKNAETKIIFISGSEFSDAQRIAVSEYDVLAFIKKEYDQSHIVTIQKLLQHMI